MFGTIGLIAVTVVVLIDLTGFVDSVKRMVWRKVYPRIPFVDPDWRPFDCSLCMTWWTGLFYLLFTGNISIANICLLSLISIATPLIRDVIRLAIDAVNRMISAIYQYFYL